MEPINASTTTKTLVDPSSNLHLSCLESSSNPSFLQQIDIQAVLSILSGSTDEYPEITNASTTLNLKHCFISLDDSEDADLLSKLRQCLLFLEQHCRPAGKGVLVHCHAGLSRSAAVVCAFLMMKLPPSSSSSTSSKSTGVSRLDKSLKQIQSQRFAFPNDNFMRQLQVFEFVGCPKDYNPDGDGDITRLPFAAELQHRILMLRGVCRKYYNTMTAPRLPGHLIASDPCKDHCYTSLFSCRRCRTALVSDRHIVSRRQDVLNVIPVLWMKKQLENALSGRLYCPKCSSKVGCFDWSWLMKSNTDFDLTLCTLQQSSLDRRSA